MIAKVSDKLRALSGLGDVLEIVAKPFARALKMDCLDTAGDLKPGTPCAERRDRFNSAVPFKPRLKGN